MKFSYDPLDEDVLIFGKGGTGKSHALQNLVLNSIKREPWWLFDGDWRDSVSGARVVHNVKDLPYGQAILQPHDKSLATFDDFCKKADSWSNLVVAVEEAHLYTGKYKIKSPYFEKIIKAGRPKGISFVCISRRPQMIHNDILSDGDHIFCFAMELTSDYEYMEEWVGEKIWLLRAPEQRKKLKNEPATKEHTGLYYNTRSGESSLFRL
jgi:hypothetical protein